MCVEQEDQQRNLVVRVTRMDHTHVQQFLREHYHNDGINKSSCARGAPPKMKMHSVPVAFARVARGKKEHILQAEPTRVIQGSAYDSGLSSPERLFRPESYADLIMETKKRCAYVLSIPHHLWEEVSDFPLLYQEDKFENSSRSNRISDTLIHTIFQGKRIIRVDVCQTADLDHIDHVIAAWQYVSSFGCRLHPP